MPLKIGFYLQSCYMPVLLKKKMSALHFGLFCPSAYLQRSERVSVVGLGWSGHGGECFPHISHAQLIRM